LLEARSGSGWSFHREASAPSKDFSEARWWELTLLPMGAYLLWAVLYYVKVAPSAFPHLPKRTAIIPNPFKMKIERLSACCHELVRFAGLTHPGLYCWVGSSAPTYRRQLIRLADPSPI